MDDLYNVFVPDVFRKYYQFVPESGDILLVVLKGHLLIEEQLNKIVEKSFKNPQFIEQCGLRFSQLLKIAMALHYKEDRKWLWEAIGQLNGVRNDFSHNLDPAKVNDKIENLCRLVSSNMRVAETDSTKRLRQCVGIILALLNDLDNRGYAI